MEHLVLSEKEFCTIMKPTPITRDAVIQDTKPSPLFKPLPDETAPRFAEYLGSFPVTEPTPDARASYVGKQLELIAKRNSSCLKAVCIAMTLSGVKICDPTMEEIYMSHALRRISYTTCVPSEKLLCFVSRNPGEPLSNQYCHSFKTEHAAEINSIIGGAFLTAYTLKRKKKKKRLSLEMIKDNFDQANQDSDRDTGRDSTSTATSQDDLNQPIRNNSVLSGSLSSGATTEDSSPEKVKPGMTEKKIPSEKLDNGLSELETRVFAALTQKAQATESVSNNVNVTRRWTKPGPHRDQMFDRLTNRSRLARRPLSYHEIFSRPRSGTSPALALRDLYEESLPEDSVKLDFAVTEMPVNPEDNSCDVEDPIPIRQGRSMSLDQNMRNTKPTDAYNHLRMQEKRMWDNLAAQVNNATLKSTTGDTSCSPAKAISDYFPFRFGKKKKEKKKYSRSKTESVLLADKTFDRLWNPKQRSSVDLMANKPCPRQYSDSNVSRLSSSPSEGIDNSDYFGRSATSFIGNCCPSQSESRLNNNISHISPVRNTVITTTSANLRKRPPVTSGTSSTSSSFPYSTYLTDATCEDSGMYTQSSNASTSSSDSCGRKSSCHSSGSDSILSGPSSIWYPQSTLNVHRPIAAHDAKSNAQRLRQSLAAQVNSTDNFVSLDEKLMSAAWYHPGIPIDVAIGILNGEEPGSFLLVRPIRKGCSYTLVVSCKSSCKLFNISKIDKVGYHIEGKNQFFPHVYIMIAQYSCHPGPLPFKLKTMQMFNPLCKDIEEE